MRLEKISLFSQKNEFLFFLLASAFILAYSLLIQYQHYKQLTRFDSALIDAKVLKQYTKNKNGKTYQVLKLQSEQGFTFYTTAKKSLINVKGKTLKLEIFATEITFYEYFTHFYAYSKILGIDANESLKEILNSYIDHSHQDAKIASIYKALYTANGLDYDLQKTFSSLGVSHLLAISGFHLGVLSAVLYLILTPIYKFFQNRFFPYRSSNRDIFIIISTTLLSYLFFLDTPPSLLRAFAMLIVGFFLYDRHINIISMQTLFISVVLLLVFLPRLFFSLGFWLSVSGVFYIFLFLLYFKHLSRLKQFVLLPIWVYLMMLPFSIVIFGGFSIYHPLSIIWTTLFSIFYPLSILLHLIGFGDLLDRILNNFISLSYSNSEITLNFKYLYIQIALSFLALWRKWFLWTLQIHSLYFLYIVWNF